MINISSANFTTKVIILWTDKTAPHRANASCWASDYNGKPVSTLGAPRIHRTSYVILVTADALVPNRHQAINNHCVDFYRDYGAIWMALRNTHTLKLECLHFDEIFITGCTGSCQNDNFQCSQWWKFRQNDIFVSVYGVAATKHTIIEGRREGSNLLTSLFTSSRHITQ